MTTEPNTAPPAALPATITFSKANLRDYIRARGKHVPLIVNTASLKEFIKEQAAQWQFNLVSVPKKLLTNCQRAAHIASTHALDAYILEKFPTPIELVAGSGELTDMEIPETLPRYTVENAMDIVVKAAEAAVVPWVLSGAHHTNPNRQAAGVAAAAARKPQEEPALLDDGTRAVEPVAVVPEPIMNDRSIHEQKTAAAVELANSEFEPSVEADVPFSGAGQAPITAEEITASEELVNLESWLTEHGLRTMELEGCEQPWICMVAGLTEDSIASKMGMKVALTQGLVVQGMTELHACYNYSAKHKLPWPETLAMAMEQQSMA